MVPVGAGAAFRQIEGVDAVRARRHRVHRVAVLVGGHRHAVPVDGAWLALDPVGESDLDAVALMRLDQRPRARSVIGEDRRVLVRNKAGRGGPGRKPRLEQAWLAGLVGKQRQFAQRLALGQSGDALRHGTHVMARVAAHARHGIHVRHAVHLRQRARARQGRCQARHQKAASMHGRVSSERG